MLGIERTPRPTGRELLYRAALLAALLSVGCTTNGGSSWYRNRWPWKSATPEAASNSRGKTVSEAQSNDRGTDAPASKDSVGGSKGISPKRAAAAALAASRRAQTAATEAEQASKEALEASKMAVRAAGQSGDQRVAEPGSEAAPKPAKVDPVVTSTPLTLSATGEIASERSREETADRLSKLKGLFHAIDNSNLSPDDANRRDIARKLLQSAQKAFDQGDYAEANGLARKASVMLAPLAGRPKQLNTPGTEKR